MIRIKNRQTNLPNSLIDQNKYDGEDVKIALSVMSTGCKCVYCERLLPKLDELNTHDIRAIEHFYPKKLYPLQKFKWSNLFWVCKNCNSTKLNYDTQNNPFVHPENDDPEDYFEYDYSHQIKVNKFSPNEEKNKNTIERTMGKRVLEITWGSVILFQFQMFEIDLEKNLKKYERSTKQNTKLKYLKQILGVIQDLKIFANDEKEYAGRRRFLIRQSLVIKAITQEINHHQTELGLSEPFTWVW